MSSEERSLRRTLSSLSLPARVVAWLEAMRRAGGLSFASASEASRREIFDIEQSTPESDRAFFRDIRDRVLGFNSMAQHLAQWYVVEIERALARVTVLLCLLVVTQAEDTRKILAESIERLQPNEGGRRTRSKRRPRKTGIPQEIIDDLVRYGGAMFAYDDSSLAAYWSEVRCLVPLPSQELPGLNLSELVAGGGDSIHRALKRLVASLLVWTGGPAKIEAELSQGLLGGYLRIDDMTMPPLDATIARCAELRGMLERTALADGLTVEEVTETDLPEYRRAVQKPRDFLLPRVMINTYEEWLYPKTGYGRIARDEEIEWRPWMIQ